MKHNVTGADMLVVATMLAGEAFAAIYAAKSRGARRVAANVLMLGCLASILFMFVMSELL